MLERIWDYLYKTGQPIYKKFSRLYPVFCQRFTIILGLFKWELMTGSSVSIPIRRRLWLWNRGFTTRGDVLFNLTEENYERYLSEYQEGLTHQINKDSMDIIDNKLTAHLLQTPFESHLPILFGVLNEGIVRQYPAYKPVPTLGEGFEEHSAIPYLDKLLDKQDTIVLKPLDGAGGQGVYIIQRSPDGYRVNNENVSEQPFIDMIHELDQYLIFEYIEQSNFMDDLYADSINTIRIVTMWDYEINEPFIAVATVRIGSPESAPLDNISQGGLLAGIDHKTGELSSVASISTKHPPIGVKWGKKHPATGTRLVGRKIPHWSAITDDITRIAAGLPQAPYLAWDILPTGGGEFMILEINSSPGMINTQLHYQFLEDPRVKQFYEHHGVL